MRFQSNPFELKGLVEWRGSVIILAMFLVFDVLVAIVVYAEQQVAMYVIAGLGSVFSAMVFHSWIQNLDIGCTLLSWFTPMAILLQILLLSLAYMLSRGHHKCDFMPTVLTKPQFGCATQPTELSMVPTTTKLSYMRYLNLILYILR